MTDNQNLTNDAEAVTAPTLPTFTPGEQKTAHITWEQVDGVVQVGIETSGFEDDLNQIGMMLAFTLEKLLDSAEEIPADQ